MLENAQKWIDISDEDLSMAEISFGHSRYLHMTFFCQQSIEKALKGEEINPIENPEILPKRKKI